MSLTQIMTIMSGKIALTSYTNDELHINFTCTHLSQQNKPLTNLLVIPKWRLVFIIY